MARYSVLLDACTLVPIALADTVLRLAERHLYRPLWSDRIVTEAADAILEIHPDLPPELVTKRFNTMEDAFEDARVMGWESIEEAVVLPDPNDRHVVSAAVAGRADAIITFNISDFPSGTLEPLNLEAIHPDDLLLDLLDLAPRTVLDTLRGQAAHTRRPALTPTDLLARLARAGVPRFAAETGRLI